MTIKEPFEASSPLHKLNLLALQVRARSGDSLALDPLFIPALIRPIQTPNADGGINASALKNHVKGLLVEVLQYPSMRANDWIDVYWQDTTVAVASALVTESDLGKNFSLFIDAAKVPEGLHPLYYEVTRAGGGNKDRSALLQILVRRDLPGGIDPDPGTPGHQRLEPPQPELPPSGIIDEEAARKGVKVTIPAYPNMREYDRITLSWGGVPVSRDVVPEEVGQAVEITVLEEVILKAGDSAALLLIYRVHDEVHNVSSDWSMGELVDVEIDETRPDAPLIVNPDDSAEPYHVIDLDVLGERNLTVNVMVMPGAGIAKGDSIVLEWVGTTSQGQEVIFGSEPRSLPQVPWSMAFEVPNADVRGLGHGRGMASYTATLADGSERFSKRAFVTFIGEEQQLPKPTVTEAVGSSLDPDLEKATVVVPGSVLEINDWVVMTWLGHQASDSPLRYTDERQVTAGGGGSSMSFEVPADYIKPLEGGRLEVHYEIHRVGLGSPLISEREYLQVGEAQHTLPEPGVSPAASNGWLDPDALPNGVDVVIAPYTNMRAGQEVHLEWRATVGGHVIDHVEIVPFSVGKPVRFPIKPEQLQQNVDGDVEVWYRVEEAGQPTRRSQGLHLKIGKETEEEAPLTEPEVLEAVDGVLDPLQGATVRVAYDDMVPGDIVAISWKGESADGTYESPQKQGSALKYLDFSIPADVLKANEGQKVTVLFARVRNGVPQLSPAREIVVRESPVDGLPTPVIPQANQDLLDFETFTGDADVTVETWPEIAEGQYYWLRAYGTKKDGSAHTIDLALGETVTAAELVSGLKMTLARSELMLLQNYSELRVELKVALSGSDNEQLATRFPLLTVSVRVEQLVIRETFNELPEQTIEFGQTLDTPTMTVSLFTPSSTAVIAKATGWPDPNGMSMRVTPAASLDLKFQCRSVRLVFLYNLFTPTSFRFYNAQGLQIDLERPAFQQTGVYSWEYKAPVGQLFSRIVVEGLMYAVIDDLTFQL